MGDLRAWHRPNSPDMPKLSGHFDTRAESLQSQHEAVTEQLNKYPNNTSLVAMLDGIQKEIDHVDRA